MSKHWCIIEPNNVYEYLEKYDNKISVGDTITYEGNNQMAYKKYEVVKENGKKTLILIDDYDTMASK